MGILNPILSKTTLTQGVPQEVYYCPPDKSHAIIDVTFFKDQVESDSLIEIALSTKSNPAELNSVDYFIDDIELIGGVNSAELNKVIVGSGERLHIRVVTGPNIVIRMTGVEESNPRVLKAGRLGAMAAPGTNNVTVYDNNLPGVSYTSCSITIYNASQTDSAEIEGWITESENPTATDKILRINIPVEDTTIIENIMLAPGERIVFRSSQPLTEYFINGVVIGGIV